MNTFTKLKNQVEENNIKIGVLGLGYVGLPLAVLFAIKGTNVLGFEKSESKVKKLDNKENYIGDVDDSELASVIHYRFFPN